MRQPTACLIALLALIGSVMRPIFAASLSEADAEYAKKREAIAWKYVEKQAATRASYSNALTTLETTLKSKGDLEGLLAVRRERESFAAISDGTLPGDASIQAIEDLRARVRKAMDQVVIEEKKEIVSSTQRFVDALKTLEKELTVGNKIDEAVLVQARRKSIMDEPDVADAVAAVQAATRVTAPRVRDAAPDPVANDDDDSKELFDGRYLYGWHSYGDGKWVVGNNCIEGTSYGDLSRLVVSESPGEDYEFSVRVKVVEGEDAGILFHDDYSQGFSYSPKSGLIERGARRNFLSPVKGFAANAWHEFKIVVHGAQVRILVDGKTVFNRDGLSLQRGRIGLCARGSSVATFENPRLKVLKATGKLSRGGEKLGGGSSLDRGRSRFD